jgi:hypothetical protein
MKFMKLMIKDSFYTSHVKTSKLLTDFSEEILSAVDVLNLPLGKVLVGYGVYVTIVPYSVLTNTCSRTLSALRP